MVNKKFWLGMLVMGLVFGMMVVGCEDETPEEKGPPAVPTGLTGEVKSSNSVELRWNSVSNAERYYVEYKKSSDTSWRRTLDDPQGTSYTVTSLDVSTAYDFHVAAWNSNGGLSSYSSPITVTTNGYSKPPMPTINAATAVNGSSSSVKITWTAVTVTDSYTPNYRVYYKKGGLASSPTDLTEATSSYPVSGTEYTITGLDALTDYVFFIKATSSSIINTNGVDSDFSFPKTAKTNVAKPSNVKDTIVTNGTNASIKVTWDAVPSATSYKVYLLEVTDAFGLNNTIEFATLKDTVTTTEVTITGLTNAKMYKFFVRASNSAGDGTEGDTSRLVWM
jgi:fibronectin type 3 domain-containing protein